MLFRSVKEFAPALRKEFPTLQLSVCGSYAYDTGPGEGELFPASDVGTLDFSDVYALANVPGISATEESNLLVISQESGEVVNISRSGHVNSRLAELAEPSDTISVPDMTNEGVTMDQNGFLYIVDEDGGGSQAHPQMWVYEPQGNNGTPPTGLTHALAQRRIVKDPVDRGGKGGRF